MAPVTDQQLDGCVKLNIQVFEKSSTPFQQYRDDNRDPLKIYTNPDYFFELWRENLQKEMEKARHIKKEKKRKAAEKNKESFDLMPSFQSNVYTKNQFVTSGQFGLRITYPLY